MRWSIVSVIFNISLLVFIRLINLELQIHLSKSYVQSYGGVIVEIILLLSNAITGICLDDAASCIFGYLLASKTGFSMAVCGFLRASPMSKLPFSQNLCLTSPSRKLLARISILWIVIDVLKILTPFSAIAIIASPWGVYNDVGSCIYFLQDKIITPVDRKWPTLDTEGGVSEYVYGSSLGIMRSEISDANITTAMYPPQLISALNDGDTIMGLGFTVDIKTTCRCANGIQPEELVSAGVDNTQGNAVNNAYLNLDNEQGLTFGTVFKNNSLVISNVFSGFELCGTNSLETPLPLVCSTVLDNHQQAMLQISFMTDGTTSSIAPNVVTFLYPIGQADIKTWLYFAMKSITNGPVSFYFTPPTVPGSLAALLWWTSSNLIGIDRGIVEAGVETMHAILFKAAIQRTYSSQGTACPRKNSALTDESVLTMTGTGYYITVVFLGLQLGISVLSAFAFLPWLFSKSPIGPAIRATQESEYLMVLLSSSPRLGIGLYDLCNAETYAIWQKLDV
ncbi:hypothetical protein HK100_008194, partial [Physocladia obscura]